MSGPIVIVGASAAGVATAEALQRLQSGREIILVGDEPSLAHDRPPLSKQVLDGAWTPEQAELLPPARREQLTARLLLGTRASALDSANRKLKLDDGSELDFQDLVIATGVRPRTLRSPTPKGVHVLRDMTDSLALRAAMLNSADRHIAIIGGGFIGLEVAATACKMGLAVTVIEPAPQVLAHKLGDQAAIRLRSMHADRGVSFKFDAGVAGYLTDETGRVTGLSLTDGSQVAASLVLLAIGCVPNVEWLAGSGVDISDGVICDEFCRAGPGIWATGDVAKWKHIGLGRHIRVEHRLNATEQGGTVATNIMGPLVPYTSTPFFWTDQFGVRLQLAGIIATGAEETVEQLGEASFLHTFRVGGRLMAVLGWNAAKAMMPYRRELSAANQRIAA